MSSLHRNAILALLAVAVVGCGPAHIKAFTPRNRQYAAGKYAVMQADAAPSIGSLYSEATPGLLQDTRAVRIGDILVVNIDEQADAKGGATTKLSKSSAQEAGVDSLLGLMPALKRASSDLDPAKLLSILSKSDFSGDGQTGRQGQLTGHVAVRVTKQMPNGDLYLEGTKVVMINNEEYHLYISGVVRPTDVSPDNSVASSRVADAQIEFTGRGDVADTVDKGWLAKLIDSINPF